MKIKLNYFARLRNENDIHMRKWYVDELDIFQQEYEVCLNTRCRRISWSSDVYYSWWAKTSIVSVMIAKLRGKKSIVVAGGSEVSKIIPDFGYNKEGFIKQSLIYLTLLLCDRIIAVSEFNKKEIVEVIGSSNENKVKVIYHCVDCKHKPSIAPKLHLEKYTVMISALTENNIKRKAIIESIAGFKKILETHRDTKLYIIGAHGEGSQRVKSTIADLNLQKNVILLGSISDEEKIRYLQNAYCYLQPTYHEQFGVAIAEAMACGCPIISTNIAAVPEVVGEAGILIESNSTESISNALLDLYENPSKRNTLSHAAIRTAHEKFSFSRKQSSLLQLINSIYSHQDSRSYKPN